MTANPPTGPMLPADVAIGTAHRRRLRALWRSAGWPFQDLIEAELLAAGLLCRDRDNAGRDTVRLTDAGVAELARSVQRNRASRQAHEDLVARVAREMQRAGRVVWRGLALRARVGDSGLSASAAGAAAATLPAGGGLASAHTDSPTNPPALSAADATDDAAEAGRWLIAMPDVYSIRHTTVEDYLSPVAHEVKVHRADLLSDLRQPCKGEAYRWLAGECWYVIREGIARPDEIPEVYGVLVASAHGPLEVARPAPQRAMKLPFAVWMSLARATPEPPDDDAQLPLDAPDGG